MKNWEPVLSESQIEKGSKLKIMGLDGEILHREITVKKVLDMGKATEILLKKKSNLYFNLTAYLHWKKTGEVTTVGRWVGELYIKTISTR